MKKLVILLTVLLSGCQVGDRPVDTRRIEFGKLRVEYFNSCMEMSSKITRQGDDDVSDIIDACDDSAYYQAKSVLDY